MAASLRLGYNPTSVGGLHVAAASRYLILAQQEMTRAIALGASVGGNGVTPTNLELPSTDFGVTVGQGAAFQNALIAISNSLATITSAQLAALDQG